jgi:hypothetical protein
MIARNATHVRLAVNRNNVALLNYRAGGRHHHTLAWGAINARTPARLLRWLGLAPQGSLARLQERVRPVRGPRPPLPRRRMHGP